MAAATTSAIEPAMSTIQTAEVWARIPNEHNGDERSSRPARSFRPSHRRASSSSSESSSPDRSNYPYHSRSLAGIALRAHCLGLTLAAGLIWAVALFLNGSPFWRLPFFLAALSTYHFLEFWVTAAYNTPAADVDAFLLTSNGPAYIAAHTLAAVECLLTKLLVWNSSFLPPPIPSILLILGILLVVLGQAIRTTAMIQAGTSFNHTVQSWRKDDHVLVTTGVYGWLRHPSYFGFFWWALGTQLVLGNRLMFVAYTIVIWRFFRQRISYEERTLVFFFGRDYTAYKARVGTWIPFIN